MRIFTFQNAKLLLFPDMSNILLIKLFKNGYIFSAKQLFWDYISISQGNLGQDPKKKDVK